MLFGTQPGFGVKADTKMIYEIAKAMMTKFDPEHLVLLLPQVFEDMHSEDANMEMIASSTCKPLRLLFRPNVATRSVAAIFYN